MAINPWVGYEASAYVVGEVAAQELGCETKYKELKEEIAWQGFGSGEVDVVIENWGHEDLKKKYVEKQGTAIVVGPNGNVGYIGWYVPPWLAEAQPDVVENWENLNDYASEFATSESGGQGQFLAGDPSFVTNDEALIENLDLDFKVVYAGSEAALITGLPQAEENQEYADRLLLRAAVVPVRGATRQGRPAAVGGGLRRRPGDRRMRLPRVHPRQDRQHRVHGVGQPRCRRSWRTSSGRTTTRTSWRSTSPRTGCPARTPLRSGSTTTPTRSRPGSRSHPY